MADDNAALRENLLAMVREGEPDEKQWATRQLMTRFDANNAQKPGPWKEAPAFTPDPLQNAIQRRAQEQAEAAAAQPPPARQKMGVLPAMGIGALQGGLADFGDEIGGGMYAVASKAGQLANKAGLPKWLTPDIIPRDVRPDATIGELYREGRDPIRQFADQAAEDQPLAYHGTNVVASVVTPFEAGNIVRGVKAVAGLGKAAQTVSKLGKATKVTARAAGDAALFGGGASEAELGDGEVGQFAKDVGVSAAAGAIGGRVIHGAANTAGKAFKPLTETVSKSLLNEAAEGVTQKATATARKKLANAADDFVNVIVNRGEDGDIVRQAMQMEGDAGIKHMQPVLDKLRTGNKAAYDAFTAAGRGNINGTAYLYRLRQMANDELQKGHKEVYKGLSHLRAEMADSFARLRGNVGLETLRGFTTETQAAASAAIGGLNEGAVKKLKNHLSAAATEAMDEMLDRAARGNKALEEAATQIRANNHDFNGLLTAHEVLTRRAEKEASEPGALLRFARGSSIPVTAGLTYGATQGGDTEERVQNALVGGLIGATAPKAVIGAGRKLSRSLTSKDVFLLRNRRGIEKAGRVADKILPEAQTVARGARGATVPFLRNPLDAILNTRRPEPEQASPPEDDNSQISVLLRQLRQAAELQRKQLKQPVRTP